MVLNEISTYNTRKRTEFFPYPKLSSISSSRSSFVTLNRKMKIDDWIRISLSLLLFAKKLTQLYKKWSFHCIKIINWYKCFEVKMWLMKNVRDLWKIAGVSCLLFNKEISSQLLLCTCFILKFYRPTKSVWESTFNLK